MRRGFRDVLGIFQKAAAANPEGDVFLSMGHAYGDARRDRTSLMFQMQAYAACEDPDVRKVVREEFAAIYKFVESVSGGDDEKSAGVLQDRNADQRCSCDGPRRARRAVGAELPQGLPAGAALDRVFFDAK